MRRRGRGRPGRWWRLGLGLGLGFGLATGCAHSTPAPPARPPTSADTAVVHIDRWQVPHILADTREGIARGLGWAQMRAYPEEIVRLYAVARGRGAEVWGERYRTSDRMVHTLDIPGRAEDALAARPPEEQRYLAAFARGMNDYAQRHPERIPPRAREVLPVRASDPLAHAHRILLAFTLLVGQRPQVMTIDGEIMPTVAGSNLWAIGPSRSASGHAMLMANPHLPWGPAALRLFEAHLVGPDAPLYGATHVGFPAIITGFNDAIAWAHTVNVIDGADAYALVPDGDGYRFDGRRREFETRTQTIEIRQDDGSRVQERFEIRRSVHGPVVELADGRLLALRAAVDDDYGGWLGAWLAMGRAVNLTEFESALETMHLPMFTVGYADRDGHVFYLSAGRIPRRRSGSFGDWMLPLPGDRSEFVWHTLLPYEQLPRVVDPPGGFVQNSNSGPWFATLPTTLDPVTRAAELPPNDRLSLRELHGLRMLTSDSSISFDDLRHMQRSSRLERADHMLDDLVLAGFLHHDWRVRHAAGVLSGWDRSTRADSRGAVLFEAWVARTAGRAAGRWSTPWSPAAPLDTPRGLADPEGAAAQLLDAADQVRARYGALDVPWGEANRLAEDLPGTGASNEALGSFHTIEYAHGPDGRGRPVAGDTFVALVELAPEGPRAEVLLSYGNASPDAPFAADQLDRVASGQMRRPLLERAEIEAAAVETTTLK